MATEEVFVLYLNDMRYTHIEDTCPVLWANNEEDIKAFLKDERLEERWTGEQGYHHSYRKDTVLEWFNPPYGDRYIKQYTKDVSKLNIPHVVDIEDPECTFTYMLPPDKGDIGEAYALWGITDQCHSFHDENGHFTTDPKKAKLWGTREEADKEAARLVSAGMVSPVVKGATGPAISPITDVKKFLACNKTWQ